MEERDHSPTGLPLQMQQIPAQPSMIAQQGSLGAIYHHLRGGTGSFSQQQLIHHQHPQTQQQQQRQQASSRNPLLTSVIHSPATMRHSHCPNPSPTLNPSVYPPETPPQMISHPLNATSRTPSGVGIGMTMTTGIMLSRSDPIKRKRGRPRKYTTDANGIPVPSSSNSPYTKIPGRGSSKKSQLSNHGLIGRGFMPHVLTVSAGEDLRDLGKVMLRHHSNFGKRWSTLLQMPAIVICCKTLFVAVYLLELWWCIHKSMHTWFPLGCYCQNNVILTTGTMGCVYTSCKWGHLKCKPPTRWILKYSCGIRDQGSNTVICCLLFCIIKLLSRTGGLSVSLVGLDGRVIGGKVAGLLLAASEVQVVLGTFFPQSRRLQARPESVEGKPLGSETKQKALPNIENDVSGSMLDQTSNSVGVADKERACHVIPLQSADWGGSHIDLETNDHNEQI